MAEQKQVTVGDVVFGGDAGLGLIAGPCVIEDRSDCVAFARQLSALAESDGIPFIFKASYDKANRSSVGSYRGPRLEGGLDILREIKAETGRPVLTDVHSVEEARAAAEVVDIIETHPNPSVAKSDSATMLPFDQLVSLWKTLGAIDSAVS